MARGEGERSAAMLRRAYDASPLVETGWLLGDALVMAGDDAAAREVYARVEKTGKQTDPRTLALFWATRNERAAEALALAEAEKKVRGDVATEDAYAWALYRNGRFDEARAAIDRALSHGTQEARLLYHAGAIRIAQGDVKQGRAMVVRAIALQPHFDVTGAAEAKRLVDDGKR
jgi:tetratricopeptide (TPR) repeat protein